MTNAGVEIPALAMKRAKHRIERRRVAAIGQRLFANLDCLGHPARARGRNGLADCGGGLVVEHGSGSHGDCLAQLP